MAQAFQCNDVLGLLEQYAYQPLQATFQRRRQAALATGLAPQEATAAAVAWARHDVVGAPALLSRRVPGSDGSEDVRGTVVEARPLAPSAEALVLLPAATWQASPCSWH